jgi:hypothetical protein
MYEQPLEDRKKADLHSECNQEPKEQLPCVATQDPLLNNNFEDLSNPLANWISIPPTAVTVDMHTVGEPAIGHHSAVFILTPLTRKASLVQRDVQVCPGVPYHLSFFLAVDHIAAISGCSIEFIISNQVFYSHALPYPNIHGSIIATNGTLYDSLPVGDFTVEVKCTFPQLNPIIAKRSPQTQQSQPVGSSSQTQTQSQTGSSQQGSSQQGSAGSTQDSSQNGGQGQTQTSSQQQAGQQSTSSGQMGGSSQQSGSAGQQVGTSGQQSGSSSGVQTGTSSASQGSGTSGQGQGQTVGTSSQQMGGQQGSQQSGGNGQPMGQSTGGQPMVGMQMGQPMGGILPPPLYNGGYPGMQMGGQQQQPPQLQPAGPITAKVFVDDIQLTPATPPQGPQPQPGQSGFQQPTQIIMPIFAPGGYPFSLGQVNPGGPIQGVNPGGPMQVYTDPSQQQGYPIVGPGGIYQGQQQQGFQPQSGPGGIYVPQNVGPGGIQQQPQQQQQSNAAGNNDPQDQSGNALMSGLNSLLQSLGLGGGQGSTGINGGAIFNVATTPIDNLVQG